MTSTLVTHRGARAVSRDEIQGMAAPEPTKTWFPTAHATVADTVEDALGNAGFVIGRVRYAVSHDNARMFATLDLEQAVGTGVNLAVGIRNSCDKSFPLGFIAGSRVFVCDNLAFRSDLMVSRKHTRFGHVRFREAIAQAVRSLDQFREVERERVRRFQVTPVPEQAADSFILRAYEEGIVPARKLSNVICSWRAPELEEFEDRTWWSLFNAFTSVLAPVAVSSPQRFADTTMRLQRLMDKEPQLLQSAKIVANAPFRLHFEGGLLFD